MKVTDAIKKDGSVKMINGLRMSSGDGKGIYLGDGSSRIFNIDNKVYVRTEGKISNGQEGGFDISADYFVPANTLMSLGTKDITWKDVWVGYSNREYNGWTKLTNGLILQWGQKLTVPGGNVQNLYNFPVTFPNTTLMLQATYSMYHSRTAQPVCITNRSESTFDISHPGGGSNHSIFWFALGY